MSLRLLVATSSLALLTLAVQGCRGLLDAADRAPDPLPAEDAGNCARNPCPASAIGARFTPIVITSDMDARAALELGPIPTEAWLRASASIPAAMKPVRDQGARRTSATFAALALLERYVGG